MGRKALIGLFLSFAIFGTLVSAVVIEEWYYPQDATVTGAYVAIYVDSALASNETLIDWGTIQKGAMYAANLTVQNIHNESIHVYFDTVNLPAGWTEIWTANATTLAAGAAAVGWMNLTVPVTTPSVDYSWGSYVYVDDTPP